MMSVAVIKYDHGMSRWEPDARGRLGMAAMELYLERGFEQTTVADIAERAGLTERTFFRHFADKKEVLFVGQEDFQALFLTAVTAAPADATPHEIIELILKGAAEFFEPGRSFSMRRASIITANPALEERELIKMAGLKVAIAASLRERGVDEPAASLTAETAVSVFHIAFATWIGQDNERTLWQIETDLLAALALVTAAG
jgi:AcrR family transcriptional regulator